MRRDPTASGPPPATPLAVAPTDAEPASVSSNSPQEPRSISRRGLFGAAGAFALLAAAGCTPFSSSSPTVTVTEEAPDPITPLMGLIYTTRLHVRHLEAAVAVDERDAAVLSMLLADRQAHLAALEAENTRVGGDSNTAPSAPPPSDVSGQSDPDEIIAVIRGDAGQAQNKFTDAMTTATPYQAELFASIAACVATHRAVLA